MSQVVSYSHARISCISPETPDSCHFQLQIEDSKVLSSYQMPGQYAFIKLPREKPSHFAITQAPGRPEWSFLIKRSSPLTEALLKLNAGDSCDVSMAEGRGFDMSLTRGGDLLLGAAGSGIAPIRAVIHQVIKERYWHGRVTLLYGARRPQDFAYHHEFALWEQNKIHVVQTISEKSKGWEGTVGYVQDLIEQDLVSQGSSAVLCGMKGMVHAVKKKLIGFGMTADHILTNE